MVPVDNEPRQAVSGLQAQQWSVGRGGTGGGSGRRHRRFTSWSVPAFTQSTVSMCAWLAQHHCNQGDFVVGFAPRLQAGIVVRNNFAIHDPDHDGDCVLSPQTKNKQLIRIACLLGIATNEGGCPRHFSLEQALMASPPRLLIFSDYQCFDRAMDLPGSMPVDELFAAGSFDGLLTASSDEEVASPPSPMQDQLDYDIPAHQVVERIESCTSWMVGQLAAGLSPDLEVGPRRLSLAGRHPESADRYARLWAVLAACHEVLSARGTSTQRELYYRLKPMDVFCSVSHLPEAIQDAVALLHVPRSALGITCSSKGLVGGRLSITDTRTGERFNCAGSGTERGRSISGDLAAVAAMRFTSDASAILVVEKDAVFSQLLAEEFHLRLLPCILVTGKGVPDVATRAFLAALHAALPQLPVLGLVDYNPSGVGILSLYRHGSSRMPESMRYALPALRWLGVRAAHLREAAGDAFQELTPRDRAVIGSLGADLRDSLPAWVAELEGMAVAGAKAEMEAAYSACGGAAGFGAMLAECVSRGDWI